MTILTVTHRTAYHYARPVGFGDHRAMFRPRDSHELRLLGTSLAITPQASLRWVFDVFGNSIGIAHFEGQAQDLVFESVIRAQHFPTTRQVVVIEPYAQHYPFSYASEDMPDLGRTIERHYPDPEHLVDLWARRFVEESAVVDTMDLLSGMARRIHDDFAYARREEVGTQTPNVTLTTRTGTCRDLSLLMMEAARSLGFAARFVSGYLYDAKLIKPGQSAMVGSGETHAWVQIYLPGGGWVEFDPTNALIGGSNLIRIAVTRDPSQAQPLTGSYKGAPEDYLGMEVSVTVSAESDEPA